MESRSGITRRDLMKNAALALPALALPRLSSASEQPAAGGPKKKVIVVGAGLAGLAAAYELVQLGHEVTVLEARTRAGGRVHTLRSPFADGLYAEAGAISFSDLSRHMVRYVETFGLTSQQLGPRGNPVYHFRGRRIVVKPGEKPEWPQELSAGEQGLNVIQLIQKYFTAAEKLGDVGDPAWRPDAFQDWDRVTLAEWLKGQGASGGAVELLGSAVWWGHGWSEVSALHRLASDVGLFLMSPKVSTLVGGMDLLTQAFAGSLRERIWYGAPVVAIGQTAGGVQVVCEQRGAQHTFEADRVICAAPAPAVRRIRFTPELPPAKGRIFQALQFSPVTRIYLQSRRRIWADRGETGGAATDLPIDLVAEHPFVRGQETGPRAVLECHTKGEHAKAASSLDEEGRIALALRELEKVHPGFRDQFEGGASYAWHDDPWAGGGYPAWKPGQLTSWVPELARPEARIHFAGEHTSWLSRTLEGAVESGNRAAKEVHEAGD